MDKKKILIISMTAGFGHLKAGQALLDYARQNLPNLDAEHIDIAELEPSFKNYSKIYTVVARYFPFAWGLGYSLFNVRLFSFWFKKLNLAGFFLHSKVEKHIHENDVDAIIFTNVAPLPLFAFAFRKRFPHIKIGIVVTDYHGNAHYRFSSIDYYFVATESVKQDLIGAGVLAEKIIITGIPVSPAFFEKQNVGDLKEKYGIKNDLPTALLIASFRISKEKLAILVEKLLGFDQKINLVVIVNNNQELYDAIKNTSLVRVNKGLGGLTLVKWTDKMAEYMKISDVVITKAGGLTVSECLTLKKPMIMINPIPGQEEYNAEFVQKNGFGRRVKTIDEIIDALPEMVLLSKNQQIDLIKPENPSKKIFQHIL